MSLLDEFGAIDKKYTTRDSSEIEKLNLERKANIEIDADTVGKDAGEALASYAEEGLSKIENKYATGMEKVDNKQTSNMLNADAKKIALGEKLDVNQKSAENKLFARGLGRSSIIVNNREAFDEARLKEFASIDETLGRELGLLEREREILLEQKDSALKSFDIAYASKLTAKVESINKELAKKQAEVDKYNAGIAKQEADYEAAQQKEIDAHNKTLSQIIDKNGIFAIDVLKQKDKYEKALAYFNGVSAEEAILELKNNAVYKQQLGDKYDALLKKMWERI